MNFENNTATIAIMCMIINFFKWFNEIGSDGKTL